MDYTEAFDFVEKLEADGFRIAIDISNPSDIKILVGSNSGRRLPPGSRSVILNSRSKIFYAVAVRELMNRFTDLTDLISIAYYEGADVSEVDYLEERIAIAIGTMRGSIVSSVYESAYFQAVKMIERLYSIPSRLIVERQKRRSSL